MVNLPEFTGKDLSEFAENFGRFLRLTGQTHASGRVKCDLLLQCCKTKYLVKQVRQIVTNSATFADVLVALERQYPTYETDLSIRAEIQNLPVLPNNPKPGRVSELLADLDHWAGRLTPGSYSSDNLLFWLVAKLPPEPWDECRSTAERKARSLRYEDLCVLLLELALEKVRSQKCHLFMERISYCGHVLHEALRSPAPSKVDAVRNWPKPKTPKQMKGFLGVVNWYSIYIRKPSNIAPPLMTSLQGKYQCAPGPDCCKGHCRVPKERNCIQWTPEMESAVVQLKKALSAECELYIPSPDDEYRIHVDPCDHGVGAVLEQQDREGEWKPCASFSCKLEGRDGKG